MVMPTYTICNVCLTNYAFYLIYRVKGVYIKIGKRFV